MIKILFVDDEENVISGLRRMLRPMRHEWDVSFASGGHEALALMAESSFDVVVSDMRMPVMDGAQLLAEVMRLHPKTVRMVLSGYSEHETVMRSVGAAHQYLSKPCEAEELKETVERTCALSGFLSNEKLRLLVTQLQTLPVLPSLYLELVGELRSSEVSLKKVGEIISKDPAMTAKMLQLVNSAFFGLRRRVTDVREAVNLLGVDMILSLSLSIQVFSQFDKLKIPGFSLDAFWSHSVRVGRFAQWMAKKEGAASSDDALTAGLLHDVGKLVLATNLTAEYAEVVGQARDTEMSVGEIELETFGTTHAEVGGYLMGLWGLPTAIVEAIVFHHYPSRYPVRDFNAVTAVHIANVLDNEAAGGNSGLAFFDEEYLDRLNLTGRIDFWRTAYREQNAGND